MPDGHYEITSKGSTMDIIAARPYLIYEMDWTKASCVLPEDEE